MPHKDTLFLLAKLQRQLVAQYNEGLAPQDYLYPSYPLYAFTEDEGAAVPVTECTVSAPAAEGFQWFFPFMLQAADGSAMDFKIIFATGRHDVDSQRALRAVQEIAAGTFPLHPRVWQRGRAVIEHSGWQIFDAAWCKAAPNAPSRVQS